MTPTTPPPTSSPSGNSLECAGGVRENANMANGIRALQAENQELRDHCYTLASHLRWASKVIAAFGKTAQLDAIEGALGQWERQP